MRLIILVGHQLVQLGTSQRTSIADNVCIEAMSVNISRRTLDRCHANLDRLAEKVRE